MSKKVNQTLTGAMAAMMATGVVATPVMAATTDVDALYKAAYTATQKALTEKTQASVNEARKAIKALPAKLDWAIGEFSKQVDSVQHPILVNIVEAIKLAEKTPTQANINAAKKAIPADLVPAFKNSYSSAVDKIQQGLQAKVVEAVKKAEASRKAEDVEAAKKLIADVATADSQALKDWAKAMQTKVEAVKLYDLEVTKAEITTTKITVVFKALTEAVRNATLEVLDNNGKAVEVEAKSVLIEGETTWTFSLKNELSKRPVGTWTVNGLKVDQDKINLVTDVKAAKDHEVLYSILNKSGLVKNLVDEVANQKEYLKAVAAAKADDKLSTVEDIQKLIDTANLTVVSNGSVEETVKASDVNKATLSKFTEEFNKLGLKRVNSDWIKSYRTSIFNNRATTDTLEEVQALVDSTNLAETVKAEADLTTNNKDGVPVLNRTKIEKAISYVEKYVVVDADKESEVKAKAARIKALEINLAIVNVNEADTQVSLKAALKALEKAIDSKTTFEYDKLVNEDVMSFYVNKNDGLSNDVDDVKAILKSGQVAAREDAMVKLAAKAVEAVKANASTSAKTAVVDAYNRLAAVTAKNEKFDATKINADLVVSYANKAKAYDKDTTVATVTADVKEVNDSVVTSVLGKVGEGEGKITLITALREIGLSNIVSANEKTYEAEINPAESWTKDTLQKKVTALNSLVEVLNSKDVTTVKNNLTKIAVNDTITVTYVDLADLVKSDVAELLIARIADSDKAEVKTLEQLDAAITEVNVDRAAKLKAVNDAKSSTSATVAALKAVSPEFKALDEVTQVTVAEKFNANRPKTTDKNGVVTINDFANFTAIRNLVNTVIK